VSALLSLVVGLGNLCLTTALSKCYEIAWWIQAVERAELHKLHFDPDVQRRISAIFSRNVIVDKFAIEAVVSLLVGIINGPLLQRASTVTARAYETPFILGQVNASIDSLPADFGSLARGGASSDTLPPVFGNVSRAYSNREAIDLAIEDCGPNTTCIFTLPAPGFDVTCVDESLPYDFLELGSAEAGDQTFGPATATNRQITVSGVEVKFGGYTDYPSYSTINTTILHKSSQACSDFVTKSECVFRLATVGYPITLTDGVAVLQNWQPGQNETMKLIRFPDTPPLPYNNTVFPCGALRLSPRTKRTTGFWPPH
jgi:hypothetical protein